MAPARGDLADVQPITVRPKRNNDGRSGYRVFFRHGYRKAICAERLPVVVLQALDSTLHAYTKVTTCAVFTADLQPAVAKAFQRAARAFSDLTLTVVKAIGRHAVSDINESQE